VDERCVQKAEDQRLEFKDPNTSAFASLYLPHQFHAYERPFTPHARVNPIRFSGESKWIQVKSC